MLDSEDQKEIQAKVTSLRTDYDSSMNQLELLRQVIMQHYPSLEVMNQLELLNNAMSQVGNDINAPWW